MSAASGRAARPTGTAARGRTARRASSISIGHVAGINIRVHLTFFLLVVLFALGSSRPGGLGVVGGLVWLTIVFGCIVVHELAHSLVARRRGASVREIVLLPIGGVSRLENLPESPSDELAIAIVGPLASVGVAGAATLAAIALRQPLLPVDLAGGPILARLVWFNLIIAGFNLLPAFPLDGGRVFRSLLERRYDLERATHLAARVGRILALTLVAVGLLANFWSVIIGSFIYLGASAEEAATIVHVRVRGVRTADVMLLDPIVVAPTTDIADLRALLRRSVQRAFPVVGTDGYEGMIDAVAVERTPPGHLASDLTKQVDVIDLTGRLEDALPLVVGSPVKAIAVVDAGRIAGLLRVEEVQHLLSGPGDTWRSPLR